MQHQVAVRRQRTRHHVVEQPVSAQVWIVGVVDEHVTLPRLSSNVAKPG